MVKQTDSILKSETGFQKVPEVRMLAWGLLRKAQTRAAVQVLGSQSQMNVRALATRQNMQYRTPLQSHRILRDTLHRRKLAQGHVQALAALHTWWMCQTRHKAYELHNRPGRKI